MYTLLVDNAKLNEYLGSFKSVQLMKSRQIEHKSQLLKLKVKKINIVKNINKSN